jgi:hypothetical protein
MTLVIEYAFDTGTVHCETSIYFPSIPISIALMPDSTMSVINSSKDGSHTEGKVLRPVPGDR